ncbi:hypothetical protein KC19_VG236300 [Ceratodon purpureus]|uniref:Uncharacterized protein n=1 Tax=Ceratodon purpureus TaxID=3225 RepID=A0A8T0HUH6_CERPU|nr:hypothetical protein KC19_VG236300 [Ceratodon purpureus]
MEIQDLSQRTKLKNSGSSYLTRYKSYMTLRHKKLSVHITPIQKDHSARLRNMQASTMKTLIWTTSTERLPRIVQGTTSRFFYYVILCGATILETATVFISEAKISTDSICYLLFRYISIIPKCLPRRL